ncbi:L-proline trans-4-hydroxylase-like [Pecten maximus]|uniref:L-proline trans-4-hydroxylase-like n=1 Tax=Pecten maximus TaxID=6579 RepID=UPI001458A78C|nr:L-proline trans-4-hydroxylase-like [Pecten maximus]
MATPTAVYSFSPGDLRVTKDMKKNFDDQGYIIIKGLFDQAEMANLKKVFEDGGIIKNNGFTMEDGDGKKAKMAVWNTPGNDVSGMMARCEKVVNTCEDLLGGEVYHYHSKLVYKDPFSGGSFLWHQDYGYWYHNSCLFPDMMTVFVAIDKCTRSNGCLEVLAGSNRCGRIAHEVIRGQNSADSERVSAIKKICPQTCIELDPGDAVFFHCNLLHTSSGNNSADRRWALLVAYNTKANNPLVPHHHSQYIPIQKVPDSSVKECTNYQDFTGKDFWDPSKTDSAGQAILEKQAKCEK